MTDTLTRAERIAALEARLAVIPVPSMATTVPFVPAPVTELATWVRPTREPYSGPFAGWSAHPRVTETYRPEEWSPWPVTVPSEPWATLSPVTGHERQYEAWVRATVARDAIYGAYKPGPRMVKPSAAKVGKTECARYRWARSVKYRAAHRLLVARWHAGIIRELDSTHTPGVFLVDGVEVSV